MMRNEQTNSPAPDGRPEECQPAWRREFPIDVPQDNYVARRDFVKFLVLTSLAFVAGQIWIGVQSLLRRFGGSAKAQRIARLADIPVGGAATFEFGDDKTPCLIVRPAEDRLHAYGQKCPHLSCAVTPDVAHGRIVCPCHKGEFDLESGRPLAGPPRRPLTRLSLEVIDGVVFAKGLELRTV